jgi:hypothetical protein
VEGETGWWGYGDFEAVRRSFLIRNGVYGIAGHTALALGIYFQSTDTI